jgi:hypothetical protein
LARSAADLASERGACPSSSRSAELERRSEGASAHAVDGAGELRPRSCGPCGIDASAPAIRHARGYLGDEELEDRIGRGRVVRPTASDESSAASSSAKAEEGPRARRGSTLHHHVLNFMSLLQPGRRAAAAVMPMIERFDAL